MVEHEDPWYSYILLVILKPSHLVPVAARGDNGGCHSLFWTVCCHREIIYFSTC